MNFKLIESPMRLLLMIAAMFAVGSIAHAQSTGITARMLFPTRNYEILLGDTITPVVRVWNTDTVAHSGMRIQYRISNAVTNVPIYANPIVLPSIAPGDSLDTAFTPYPSNPNMIDELGTFNGCLYAVDTVCGRLFGMREMLTPFFDASNGYSKTGNGDIPDQTLWVSVGATVVDGEDSTWDPPPPRYPPGGVGPDTMISPVIRLDRLDYNGNFYSGTGVGDTLTSFPINMAGKPFVSFSFDFMRGGRHHYPLEWDDSVMFGPESTIIDSAGNVIRAGDSLILEFEKPAGPAANPDPNDWNEMAAIDGGRDFEYKTFVMSTDSNGWQITVNGITTSLKDTTNYFTADFRFRFRLKANNNASKPTLTADDADQWYLDNIELALPGWPQVGLSWVRVVNPYSKVPLSQAVFPVFVRVFNFGIGNYLFPPVYVEIVDPNGDTVYRDSAIFSDLTFRTGVDTTLQLSNWDASHESGMSGAQFTAMASISPGVNLQDFDNTQTYSKFYLNFDNPSDTAVQEFALDNAGLDPGLNAGNDIPKLVGLRDEGIGFINTSGSFAMKFQLVRPDTFYGVRAYITGGVIEVKDIRISLFNGDPNSNIPLDTVEKAGFASTMLAQESEDFDQFSTYYFPQPIPLQPGTYWVSVSQLGVENSDLGGIISRGGGQIARKSKTAPEIAPIYTSKYGTQWGNGPGDNNGNVSCSYAMETPAGSGNWKPWMPDSGLWPVMDTTSNLAWHFIPSFDKPYVGAGTYFPTIRAIFAGHPTSGVKTTPVILNFGLESIYPNPFDPSATSMLIHFTLGVQSRTTITISNVLGKVVKILLNENFQPGTYPIAWDGRDENGMLVPAGIYLISLTSGGHRATEKIIVTK